MDERGPTITEQLVALREELALAQAISGGPAGSEPAYRYLANSPGMLVIQEYLQQWSAKLAEGQALPVFYVELPALGRTPLVEVLSRPLGLRVEKKEVGYFAEQRLGEELTRRNVEFTFLTNAHQLASRPNTVEWLVCFFRQHLPCAPLILVGEGEDMDKLLLWNATAWVIRRFRRIKLPGEPQEERGEQKRLSGE